MTKNETFSGRREFPIAGHYFELLSTVSVVDLEFFDSDGRMIANELQVEEGYFVDRRGVRPFARFAIITGASEAVKFLVTDGLSGQRSALADVTSSPTRQLGIVSESGQAHVAAAKTVTTTAANHLAALATRKYLCIQNQDAAGIIYVRCDGTAATATAASLKMAPGDVWEPKVVPTGAVSAIGDIASNANVHMIEA
jgi:hypothetical protein